MKPYFLCVASLLLLCSCKSKPLTEGECRVLVEKEMDFAVSRAPAGDADSMREFLSGNLEGGIANCASGKSYNRSDYKCMTSAGNSTEIGKCIDEATKHIGR